MPPARCSCSVRKSIEVDLALLERYDTLITDLELTLVRTAKQHDADAFHRLRSVPGIGKVLALTILYEIHDITRFDRVQQFASYARLPRSRRQRAPASAPSFSIMSHRSGSHQRLMGGPRAIRPRTTRSLRRCPFPEPADNGRAPATSLVMRRPVRGHE